MTCLVFWISKQKWLIVKSYKPTRALLIIVYSGEIKT